MSAALELEVYENRAPRRWDEDLRATAAVVFHSEAWASYKARESGGEPLFFVWRESGEGVVVGRALGIRRPPRSSRQARIGNRLVFDSVPATARAGFDFVSPLNSWGRRSSGLVEVALGSFDTAGEWAPGGFPNPRHRLEFILPSGGTAELRNAMRKRVRRRVDRAAKAGLRSALAGDEAEFHAFVDLYTVTLQRLSHRKQDVSELRMDRADLAEAMLGLAEAGAGRLYLSFAGPRPEAGVLFATFADRAYLIHTGATDSGRDADAPVFVLAEAVRDLRESGHDVINLGGASGDAADPNSSDNGLYTFKTRFGGEPEPRVSGSLRMRGARCLGIAAVRRVLSR